MDADQFINSVLATVSSTVALQKCTPNSIALAAYEAATLGLPVNKLALAYLVPYGNEAKLLISYRGYIQLSLDTGFVLDISAEVIYANDQFKQILGTTPRIEHAPAMGERGEILGVYAIARLANGLVKQCVMSREQVDKIRNTCSKSANGSAWSQHYEEMAKKTVIKRLCKTLPSQGQFDNIARAIKIDDVTHEIIDEKPLVQPQLASPASLRQVDANQEEYYAGQVQIAETENQPEPANPLLGKVLDLQSELESLDAKAEKLPDTSNFTDGQYHLLARKKQEAIKEAIARKGK